jgi:hypothetical protein
MTRLALRAGSRWALPNCFSYSLIEAAISIPAFFSASLRYGCPAWEFGAIFRCSLSGGTDLEAPVLAPQGNRGSFSLWRWGDGQLKIFWRLRHSTAVGKIASAPVWLKIAKISTWPNG